MKNFKKNGLFFNVLGFILITVICIQNVEAQQGFSRMTVSADGTTLTTQTWDVANGTNINTVDGPKYFGSSSNNGDIAIYNQDTNTRYEPGNRLGGNTNTSNSNEPIGTETASYMDSVINSAPFFKDQNNSANTIPISATRNAPNGTINGVASSSPKKILKMEFILNNLISLPNNTRIFIGSRPGNLGTGGSRNGIADGIKIINGIVTEPTVDPRGNPLNNQGPTLGFENFDSALILSIYPNPATTNISINSIYGFDFGYEVYDATGRKMLYGTALNNQLIDIQMLATGNYFIKIIDNKGRSETNKIIKK